MSCKCAKPLQLLTNCDCPTCVCPGIGICESQSRMATATTNTASSAGLPAIVELPSGKQLITALYGFFRARADQASTYTQANATITIGEGTPSTDSSFDPITNFYAHNFSADVENSRMAAGDLDITFTHPIGITPSTGNVVKVKILATMINGMSSAIFREVSLNVGYCSTQ